VRDNPTYVGDHVIRHYRSLGLAALLRDLDADPSTPAMTIVGGIGTLTLRADGSEQWKPVTVDRPPPATIRPSTMPADEAARRVALCRACPHYRADSNRCGLCGCAFVIAERIASLVAHCPEDRW
jgi:hypothetical protein